MITQAINLNLIPGQVLPRVNVSQYDSGTRTLRMTLFNGEQIFNVPSGASGYIQGTKPDRTGFQYAATVTAGSNIVTIDITQQMTAVKGEVVCELVLANGDDRIATVNFIIYVEPAALADDTVISETDLPLIEQAAELAQEIEAIADQVAADAQTASDAAQRAEEWASDSPYIGANGHWFVYDTTLGQFVDTNINATGPQGATGPTGPQGPQGDAATITVGTVTTLPAGSQATVTNSGTSEEAVFNFGIPKGQDGLGAGDMLKADYDANGAVELAGGIASYVSGAISGKANTADLGTAAYKDSTNAITENSTDLIESGAVYPLSSSVQTLSTQSSKISQAIRYMQIFTGAKNLLKNKLASSVANGLTITVHSNGAISVSGRAEANVVLKINDYSAPITNCVLSGCPNGGGSQTYELRFLDGGGTEYYDYGNSVTIPASTTGAVWLVVRSGQTMNHVFYPMICLATELAPTEFTEFALSNQLLTQVLSRGDLNRFEAGRSEQVDADYVDFVKKDGTWNRLVMYDTRNALTIQHFDASGTLTGSHTDYGATGVASGVIGGATINLTYSKGDRTVTCSSFIDITTDWTGWSPTVITGFPKPLTDAYSFSYAFLNNTLHEIIAVIHANGGMSIYSSLPSGSSVRIKFNFAYITND